MRVLTGIVSVLISVASANAGTYGQMLSDVQNKKTLSTKEFIEKLDKENFGLECSSHADLIKIRSIYQDITLRRQMEIQRAMRGEDSAFEVNELEKRMAILGELSSLCPKNVRWK